MIQQKIKDDLNNFLKAGKSFETGVLRLIMAVFKNKEIEKKGKGLETELTNEEIIDLLMKEVKKRKEATDVYKKGDRNDLAEKEIKELEVIKKYLPEELSAEEIEKIVVQAIAATAATSVKDISRVMAETMKELKGRTDASTVGAMIKKKLENGK